MPYTPPSGASVTLDLQAPSAAPSGVDVNLEFSTVTAQIRQAGGFSSHGMGVPCARLAAQYLRPQGLAPPPVPAPVVAKDTPRVYPTGIGPGGVGTPAAIWTQVVSPEAIPEPISPRSVDRVRLLGGYTPPPAFNTILNWGSDPYAPPPGANVILEFGALGYGHILGVTAGSSAGVGTPTVTQTLGIQVIGIPPGGVGTPTVQSSDRTISLSGFGIAPGAFGTPEVTLNSWGVWPPGIAPGGVGAPSVELKNRVIHPNGIAPPGMGFPIFGQDIQVVSPAGIAPGGVGTPTVSLKNRTLFPAGIVPGSVGVQFVSLRVRMVSPAGIAPGRFGHPAVHYPQDARLTNYALLLTM